LTTPAQHTTTTPARAGHSAPVSAQGRCAERSRPPIASCLAWAFATIVELRCTVGGGNRLCGAGDPALLWPSSGISIRSVVPSPAGLVT
jgi:hypothetical protein